VPRPSEIYAGIPLELEKIVLKSLEKDPDHRFQTARDFLHAIEEYERTGSAAGALRSASTGPRQTVIQPHRATPAVTPTVVSTVGAAGATTTAAQSPNVATVNNAPLNIPVDNGYQGEGTIGMAAPAKSKLPIIIGVALVVLIAAGVGYKLMTGSTSTVSPGQPNTGNNAGPANIPGMILIPVGTFKYGT